MKFLQILIILLSINIQAQTEFDDLSECFFTELKNGDVLKNEILKFETFLIRKNILESNSGQSYFKLFQNASLREQKIDYKYSFLDSIKEFKTVHTSKCDSITKRLLSDKKSKSSLLQEKLYSLNNEVNISPKLVAEKILEVLNANDFENYLQKMKTLIMIENFKLSNQTSEIFENDKLNNNEKKLAVRIEIDDKNIVKLNGEVIELNSEFDKKIIQNSLNGNISININASEKASFSVFMKLKDRLYKINSDPKYTLKFETEI